MRITLRSAVLCALASLTLTMTGCLPVEPSDAVDQGRIHTMYDLWYDGNQDMTFARASFHFGNALGTQLELSESSSVVFEGKQLVKYTLPVTNLTYYEATFAGLKPSGSFVYTNDSGAVFTNALSMREISFPTSLPNPSLQQSYELIWSGDPVAAGEEVHLVFFKTTDIELAHTMQNAVGSLSVIMPRNKIQSIPAGQIYITLERKVIRSTLAQAPAAGGSSTARYWPVNAGSRIEQ